MTKGYTHPIKPIPPCSSEELANSGKYSRRLLEAIEGSLLGDANAEFWGHNARFRIDLSGEHMDALELLHAILVEMEPGLRHPYYAIRRPGGDNSSVACCLETRLHPLITWFFRRWYWLSPSYGGRGRTKKGETKKILPRDVMVVPVSTLFWHIGDGSLRWLNGEPWTTGSGPLLTLATSCFTREEVECLSKKLWEKLQVTSTVFFESDKRRPGSIYWNINASGRENVAKFFQFISIPELIPKSYHYRFNGFLDIIGATE